MAAAATKGFCADSFDPLLEVMIKNGLITEEQAEKVKAQAEAMRTNNEVMPPIESKWKISKAIKNVELFGDIRLRFEDREVKTPPGDRLELQRGRVALRLGLRGEAFDDFYYGLRLETASNPRSPWVTFGTSSSGVPYQGPFGKSTAGIDIGQIYLGWRPWNWVDLTVGKMPQPLYTTPMVWDTDLSPEGAAERFNYKVGAAEFFATFGQFLYQDVDPSYASPGLVSGILQGQSANTVFLLAWQGGLTYHITKDITAKAAATLYRYIGAASNTPPFFGDPYVGEGAYLGPGIGAINGNSGWTPGASATAPGLFNGFPNNQGGLNHLLVVEVPFELNFKISKLDARLFGDVAYNLEGKERAEEAAAGYAAYLSENGATISGFAPQTKDVKAYQFGLGVGSGGLTYGPAQGVVYGSTSRKRAWEVRSYWQHIEQYALDPSLIDSDFFEGRANLEGIYAAAAYCLADNVIATIRYGYARRINDKLGTGGDNQDIPQVNPIEYYKLFQLDLTLRF